MKYKLLKKIEGIDWGVGETKEVYTRSGVALNCIIMSSYDLHNLLLNGTIERVEERWRANTGEFFFYVDFDWFYGVRVHVLKEDLEDDEGETYYQQGNYFRTREQAQEVADKIKQILKESHERN